MKADPRRAHPATLTDHDGLIGSECHGNEEEQPGDHRVWNESVRIVVNLISIDVLGNESREKQYRSGDGEEAKI